MKNLIIVLTMGLLFVLPVSLYSAPKEIGELNSFGVLSGCNISISYVHVLRRIAIGGKLSDPVHVNLEIVFDNKSDKDISIDCESYLYDDKGEQYQITLGIPKEDIRPSKWKGKVNANKKKVMKLSAWDGPVLNVGSKTVIVIKFTDLAGNYLWLKSETVPVTGKPEHHPDIEPKNDIFRY